MVKIGHARIDENNNANGGKAGDQSGKEVVIQDWYLHKAGWKILFRPKDSSTAEKIAKTMEAACNNDNIGYDQWQRTSLYEQASKLNWNLSKVSSKCECDCSSLVAVCVNAAGITVNKNMYTGNQKSVLTSTGKFDVLTDIKYLTKTDYLKRGDILLGQGHTAVVLSDGIPAINVESAKNFDKNLAGIYHVNANNLNVRQGAGTNKQIIITIPKGTKVNCFGYCTKINHTNWLYVQFTYNGANYTGFISAKYLKK